MCTCTVVASHMINYLTMTFPRFSFAIDNRSVPRGQQNSGKCNQLHGLVFLQDVFNFLTNIVPINSKLKHSPSPWVTHGHMTVSHAQGTGI